MISDLLGDLREFESKGTRAAVIGPTLIIENLNANRSRSYP
jgi:hypothetical protein